MPTFKFRLESVLEFRKKMEEQRQRELAHLKELLQKEQDFLKELENRTADIQIRIKKCQSDSSGRIDIEEILQYYRYFIACRERTQEQITLIESLIESVEKKREDLITASKERKIIEKLKENQYQEFKHVMDSWETKIIDELATSGYTHRKEVR